MERKGFISQFFSFCICHHPYPFFTLSKIFSTSFLTTSVFKLHFSEESKICESLSLSQMATLLGFSQTKFHHCGVWISTPPCSSSSTVVSMVGLNRTDSKKLRSDFLGQIGYEDRRQVRHSYCRSSLAVKMSWDGPLASVKLIIQGKNLEVWILLLHT